MFLGTPTGSLLVPHFATNDLGKLYDIFTNVSQQDIFSVSLFI
jgi:NTE family protein